MGLDQLNRRVFKMLYWRIIKLDITELVQTLPNAKQLIEILFIRFIFGVGPGGKVGVNPHFAVVDGDRLAQSCLVALGTYCVGWAAGAGGG